MDDHRALNRADWDGRAPAHAASPGYALDRFRADPEFISDVVRFDLPLLGDISGQRGVHLQCHLGTDTISLARLGARMTGLDFSPAAVEQANALSEELGAGVDFVDADVYGLVIETLVEHDSVPWDAFPGFSEELPNGEHRLQDRPWRLPHSCTISARRRQL